MKTINENHKKYLNNENDKLKKEIEEELIKILNQECENLEELERQVHKLRKALIERIEENWGNYYTVRFIKYFDELYADKIEKDAMKYNGLYNKYNEKLKDNKYSYNEKIEIIKDFTILANKSKLLPTSKKEFLNILNDDKRKIQKLNPKEAEETNKIEINKLKQEMQTKMSQILKKEWKNFDELRLQVINLNKEFKEKIKKNFYLTEPLQIDIKYVIKLFNDKIEKDQADILRFKTIHDEILSNNETTYKEKMNALNELIKLVSKSNLNPTTKKEYLNSLNTERKGILKPNSKEVKEIRNEYEKKAIILICEKTFSYDSMPDEVGNLKNELESKLNELGIDQKTIEDILSEYEEKCKKIFKDTIEKEKKLKKDFEQTINQVYNDNRLSYSQKLSDLEKIDKQIYEKVLLNKTILDLKYTIEQVKLNMNIRKNEEYEKSAIDKTMEINEFLQEIEEKDRENLDDLIFNMTKDNKLEQYTNKQRELNAMLNDNAEDIIENKSNQTKK